MRAPRVERGPSRGGAAGGGGNLAQFHLAAARQEDSLVPGERPIVRAFLPGLPTIRFFLSPVVFVLQRGGRPERGGRGPVARAGMPAANDSGGRQPEIRRRATGRTSSARCAGDAAPARGAGRRAAAGWGQHPRGRGSDSGRTIPPVAPAFSRFVSGAGAATF